MGLNFEQLNQSKYIGANGDYEGSNLVLIGCPLDVTSSFRSGSKFAPESIRKASWTLETYSPYLKGDLGVLKIFDAGNIPLIPSDLNTSFDLIEGQASDFFKDSKKVLFLGGEHLITYPVAKALKKNFKTFQIIHFDAHWDMRDSYEGMQFCHATVMKRIKDLGITKIFHVGIRSGTEEEFKNSRIIDSPQRLKEELDFSIPVYITFDMDVIDPSLVPGVSTPEPDGLMFGEVMEYFISIAGVDVVGADVVELAPDYDWTFVSSICAAKVVREIMILMHKREY
ncbi:MAG: agmatinase [Deltaproteobacteria bacterium]|nr:agmatinase [Deltaproteobacteria bacterium]